MQGAVGAAINKGTRDPGQRAGSKPRFRREGAGHAGGVQLPPEAPAMSDGYPIRLHEGFSDFAIVGLQSEPWSETETASFAR